MKRTRSRRRKIYLATTDTAPRSCPVCRERLDAATGMTLDRADQTPPTIGDITICAYCGTLLVFTIDGFRLATDTEFRALDPTLQQVLSELIRQKHTQ